MCVLCGPGPAEAVVDHSIDHPFELKPETDFECATCGQHVSVHPDKREALAKFEMDSIIKRGHQVRYIFGDVDRAPFAYSMGRSIKDRPELLAVGLGQDTLAYLVNRVAKIDDERPVSAGMELDDVLEGYKVRLVQVRDLKEAEMHGVVQYFGADTPALQILWPDKAGKFPGEDDYEYPADAQPVFA